MSEAADIAAHAQRFNDAARAFTPPLPSRHAKLMPLKDGIVELRQKGASLRLIRELLATVDVAVGTDTIARFLAEVMGDSTARGTSRRRSRRHDVVAVVTHAQTAAVSTITAPSPRLREPAAPPQSEAPPERLRTRGPRIADPRNL